MCQASFASDAMVCLSQFCHAAVVSDEECAASFTVVLVLHFGDIALVDTFIIVGKYGENVNPERAGHTILAVVIRAGVCGHQTTSSASHR